MNAEFVARPVVSSKAWKARKSLYNSARRTITPLLPASRKLYRVLGFIPLSSSSSLSPISSTHVRAGSSAPMGEIQV